jgi:hypothetical protein
MGAIDSEIGAFESMKASLEAEHMGKWVVIHDLILVGIFDAFEGAADRAVTLFGRGPYLIRQVGAQPLTLPAAVMFHPVHGH